MGTMRRHVLSFLYLILSPVAFSAQPPAAPFTNDATPVAPDPLRWDADSQSYAAKPGETTAHFVFQCVNPGKATVQVLRVTPSCGCTTARMPDLPWSIPPGGRGTIDVDVDLQEKRGHLQKEVEVETDQGIMQLEVAVTIPAAKPAAMGDRSANLADALHDRQAVFHGDCARCHAEPARDRMGLDLYRRVCGVCHEAERRAEMVPDLRTLDPKLARDPAFWRPWITEGKPGTLMPAFARKAGGPLDDAQIESLARALAESRSGAR